MDEDSRFIAKRALLAAGLTAGFYLLAVAIIGILLFIPYAEWRFGNRIHLKILVICLGAAGAIVAALIPPKDDFKISGMRLDREGHPRLFMEVDDIAKAMDQAPPSEVYLVPEVNAWVTEYGGRGGSRRIMGLGLPLLAVLDLSQLRAVLAHEFGHYYGGDTRLGPWLYRTRMAIGRTTKGLAEKGHSVLQVPFRKYGELFLRVTQKVSRLQELKADELAARYAGAQAMTESLRTIHSGGVAFDLYWGNEVVPVLEEGYVPPILKGYTTFMKQPQIEDLVSRYMDESLKDSAGDLYDSHPPLRQRLGAIEKVKDNPVEHRREPALSILRNVEDLEKEMITSLARVSGGPERMEPVAWDDVGQVAFLPRWRKMAAAFAGLLEGLFPENLPGFIKNPEDFYLKLAGMAEGEPSREDIERKAASVVGASLAVVLAGKGWIVRNELGAQVRMEKDGVSLNPFAVVPDLASGRRTEEAWKEFCGRTGIAGMDLGQLELNTASSL